MKKLSKTELKKTMLIQKVCITLSYIKNIKFRDTKVFLKFYGSWKIKGFYSSNLGFIIQSFYKCVILLFYIHMFDYSRYSSHENLVWIKNFNYLDDLCASRELGIRVGNCHFKFELYRDIRWCGEVRLK